MPILSDGTIRERMSNGELVLDGLMDAAEHCTYEFSVGRVFRGGRDPSSEEAWNADGDPHIASIEPGELVWIRTRERVKMPDDHVGLWCQTNTLSRQGLLLLNMSLVEPGYEGPLTAVFVNFGKRKVTIAGDTRVAKLLFARLDKPASVPFKKRIPDYDRVTADIATNSPQTFLQFADLFPRVADAVEDARAAVIAESRKALESAKSAMEEQKKSLANELAGDIGPALRKLLGGYLAGLVLALGVTWFALAQVYPILESRYSGMKSTVTSSVADAENGRQAESERRLERLERRLEAQSVDRASEQDLSMRVRALEDLLQSQGIRQ